MNWLSALRRPLFSKGAAIVLGCTAFAVGYVALLATLQDVILFHPRRYHNQELTHLDAQHHIENLSWNTEHHGEQHSWLITSPHGQPVESLWVLFQGNAGAAIDWLQFIEHYYRMRPQVPVAFLLVEYAGYGKSGGSPSFSTIRENVMPGLKLAMQHIEDKHASRPKINIGGFSLGCAASMLLSSQLQRENRLALQSVANQPLPYEIGNIVLFAPFTSITRMAFVIMSNFLPIPWLHSMTHAHPPSAALRILDRLVRHPFDNELELVRFAGETQLLNSSATVSKSVFSFPLELGHPFPSLTHRPVSTQIVEPNIIILHGQEDEIVPHDMGVSLSQLLSNSQAADRLARIAFPDHNINSETLSDSVNVQFASIPRTGHNTILVHSADMLFHFWTQIA